MKAKISAPETGLTITNRGKNPIRIEEFAAEGKVLEPGEAAVILPLFADAGDAPAEQSGALVEVIRSVAHITLSSLEGVSVAHLDSAGLAGRIGLVGTPDLIVLDPEGRVRLAGRDATVELAPDRPTLLLCIGRGAVPNLAAAFEGLFRRQDEAQA